MPRGGAPPDGKEADRNSSSGAARRFGFNLCGALMMLKSGGILRFRGAAHTRVDAAAPYFIHIVRANRAADMIDPCSGVRRAGQHKKQTVAG